MNTSTVQDCIDIEDMLACPFCGSLDLTTTDWWTDDGEFTAIACLHCQAEAPATVWNNRTSDDVLSDELRLLADGEIPETLKTI